MIKSIRDGYKVDGVDYKMNDLELNTNDMLVKDALFYRDSKQFFAVVDSAVGVAAQIFVRYFWNKEVAISEADRDWLNLSEWDMKHRDEPISVWTVDFDLDGLDADEMDDFGDYDYLIEYADKIYTCGE